MRSLIAAVNSLSENKEVIESSDLAATASAHCDTTGIIDHPVLNANKEVYESSDLDGCAKESPSPRSPVSPYLDPSLWETGEKNSPNLIANNGSIVNRYTNTLAIISSYVEALFLSWTLSLTVSFIGTKL